MADERVAARPSRDDPFTGRAVWAVTGIDAAPLRGTPPKPSQPQPSMILGTSATSRYPCIRADAALLTATVMTATVAHTSDLQRTRRPGSQCVRTLVRAHVQITALSCIGDYESRRQDSWNPLKASASRPLWAMWAMWTAGERARRGNELSRQRLPARLLQVPV
jgi:hypothetical protein